MIIKFCLVKSLVVILNFWYNWLCNAGTCRGSNPSFWSLHKYVIGCHEANYSANHVFVDKEQCVKWNNNFRCRRDGGPKTQFIKEGNWFLRQRNDLSRKFFYRQCGTTMWKSNIFPTCFTILEHPVLYLEIEWIRLRDFTLREKIVFKGVYLMAAETINMTPDKTQSSIFW